MVEQNAIIETANKIINKQGNSVMLDSFFQIVVMYASKPTHTESKEKIR